MLAPRDQVLNALKGSDDVDRVVITAEARTTTASDVERRLRNLGMCLVADTPPIYHTNAVGVKEEKIFLHAPNGEIVEQVRVHTSAGDLNSVVRYAADQRESHTVKRLFQKPGDYAALVAMVEGQRYVDSGDEFAGHEELLGSDVLIRPHLGYTPMHAIMHELMGVDVFAEEWTHRRQEILTLYKALVESRRRLFEIVAHSSAPAITYGGHLNAREIGEDRFNRYYLPAFHEFADVMHGSGRLAGLHISGDPSPLAKGIARTRADYVEGFRPTRDFSLADARRAWPHTALWVEVPPDVHQRPLEDQMHWVGAILKQGRGLRVLLEIGVGLGTQAYRKSLLAVAGAVDESMKGKPLAQTQEAQTQQDRDEDDANA